MTWPHDGPPAPENGVDVARRLEQLVRFEERWRIRMQWRAQQPPPQPSEAEKVIR